MQKVDIISNLDSHQHPDRGGAGPAQEELHAGRALREVGGAGRPQLQESHRSGQTQHESIRDTIHEHATIIGINCILGRF